MTITATENNYKELVEILQEGIWMIDENSITTFVNPRMASMLGFTVEEIQGKSLFDYFPEKEKAVIHAKVANRRRGIREQYDSEMIKKNGSIINVSITATPLLDAQGQHRGSVTVIADISERKKLERAVSENLRFVQVLMDAIPNPLYYKGLDGRYLGCNEVFAQTLQMPKEKIIGHTIHEIAPPEISEKYSKLDQELFEQGGVQSYEGAMRDNSGHDHPAMFYKATYNGANGERAGLLGVVLDIAELKNTQNILSRRIKYEEAVINCSTTLLARQYVQDPIGDVFTMLLQTTGVSRVYRFVNVKDAKGGLCMRQIREVCAPGVAAQINDPTLRDFPYEKGAQRWEEILSKGQFMLGQTSQFPSPEKEFFESQGVKSILALPVFIDGNWNGFIGFDETKEGRVWTEDDIRLLRTVIEMIQAHEEQQRYEKELSEREATLSSITSAAKDAIIMMDHDGRISFWNEAAATILQYSRDEAMGANLHEVLMPERFREAHAHSMNHFRLTGQGPVVGKTVELAARRKDGVEVPIELSLSAVMLNGKWNAVGIMRDISERKKAELERESMMDQLIQSGKMASLGEMAAGIAHELNTPLNVILGYLQLMDKKLTAEEKLRDYCRTCLEEADICRQLIGDLLLYARPIDVAGSEVETVSLTDVVHSALKLMAINKYHDIKISMNLDRNAPSILGSRKQLTHLVVNLVKNAIQAMDNGGELSICVREMQGESPGSQGQGTELQIIDTGMGIPPENMDKIFDPFFTTKRPGRGTGLGLSICLRFVEQFGGKIRVDSQPGKGTIVVVSFPAKKVRS